MCGGEDWNDLSESQGPPGIAGGCQKPGHSGEWILSRNPEGISLQNLNLRHLTSRMRKKKYLLLNFKQPSCWSFMTAATGN